MDSEFDPALYHANQGKMYEKMLVSAHVVWPEATNKQRVAVLNTLVEQKDLIEGEIIRSLAECSLRHFLKQKEIHNSTAKQIFLAQYSDQN